MTEAPVTIVARIKAKPASEQRVREELAKLPVPTREEKGCIDDYMHESVDDPALFLFYENWTTEDDWRTHLESPHIQRWINVSDQLLAEPMDVTIWKRVD